MTKRKPLQTDKPEHNDPNIPPEGMGRGCFWLVVGPSLIIWTFIASTIGGCFGCHRVFLNPPVVDVDNDPEPVQPTFPDKLDENGDIAPLNEEQFNQLKQYLRDHKAWVERHKH